MNIHILGLPHIQVTKNYCRDAYGMKIFHMCQMLIKEGYDVTLYAGEENETPARLVTCMPTEIQNALGFNGPEDYLKLNFDQNDPMWRIFNAYAINALAKRVQPGDIIGVFGSGVSYQAIKDACPMCYFVELGIGYSGVCADFRVFESHAWMHTIWGATGGCDATALDGKFYDVVIPNYFDPADFPFSNQREDYILFVGRMIRRKGLQIVADMAARMPNTQFILAGQGATQNGSTITAQDITITGNNLQYIGPVDMVRRGELMSKARALVCPTLYIGPFEGVHVEAMMCGTPVITTPFGVFTETFIDKVHGYRCYTIKDFVEAADNAWYLDHGRIRGYAKKHFSMDVVAREYVRYFNRLEGLGIEGFCPGKGGFYEP